MNETLKVIRNRRTIRRYKEEQIKDSDLDAILEAGLYAPSAVNNQSWFFTVVQNQKLLEELNLETKELGKNSPVEAMRKMSNNKDFNVFFKAPTVIVVSTEDEALLAEVNCAAAMQNMSIAAESLGLGTMWNGAVRSLFESHKSNDFKEKLKVPKGYSPFLALAIGYKEGEVSHAPSRKGHKVEYLK